MTQPRLVVCARHFGILVHAVTLMSTHEHLIVTDPQGRYPEFRTMKRPEAYFHADNSQWPDTIELSVRLPPGLEWDYGA
jgi:hypothetical protein